jgi:hypothetical protein
VSNKFQLSIATLALLVTKVWDGSREKSVSGLSAAAATATPDSLGTTVFTFTDENIEFAVTRQVTGGAEDSAH